MKKTKNLVLKHRAHSVLFERELPFKPKTERNRKAYQRQSKHRLIAQ